jgi:hypothetical protein
MASQDLRAVIRIKSMARAAADVREFKRSETGAELAAAYERLRQEARSLHERAGWGDGNSFDRELPPLHPDIATTSPMSAGRRALVLLGQLAAWAEGYQEVFEIEAGLRAQAEAKIKTASKQPTGFRS